MHMQCGSITCWIAFPRKSYVHHTSFRTAHVCWWLQNTKLPVSHSIWKKKKRLFRNELEDSYLQKYLSFKIYMHTGPFSCVPQLLRGGGKKKTFQRHRDKAGGIHGEINRAGGVMTFWLGHIWWLQWQFRRNKLLKLRWFFLTLPFAQHLLQRNYLYDILMAVRLSAKIYTHLQRHALARHCPA